MSTHSAHRRRSPDSVDRWAYRFDGPRSDPSVADRRIGSMDTANALVVRRMFEEVVNGKRLDLVEELLAPDYVNHDMPTPAPGPEGMRQTLGMFFAAFPDMHVEIDHVIADSDLVCSHGRFTGTHRGDFMGVPASDRAVAVEYIDVWRFVDGKGAENWVRLDMLGLLEQIGAVSVPARG